MTGFTAERQDQEPHRATDQDSGQDPARGLHRIGIYRQATAEGSAAVVMGTRLVADERHITYRTDS
jgi:hypothetical protein